MANTEWRVSDIAVTRRSSKLYAMPDNATASGSASNRSTD